VPSFFTVLQDSHSYKVLRQKVLPLQGAQTKVFVVVLEKRVSYLCRGYSVWQKQQTQNAIETNYEY
jgi:hypothetical protein